MEVTTKNFKTLLPTLKTTVENAAFFAIDTEFTGLQRKNGVNQFDSPAEYFAKTNELTKDYIVIQFGLTAFFVEASTDNGSSGKIKYESYNFYLYPRSENQRFACQGESMSFLASHNFDFNKLFSDGISFCDMEEAVKLRERQEDKVTLAGLQIQNDVAVPEAEEGPLQKIRDDVKAFLLSDDKEIVIDHCNAFQRKLVYQMLEQQFMGQVSTSSRVLPNSNKKVIVVEKKKSTEEENKFFEEKRSKEKDDLENFIGFTNFMEILSDSKKLIVGHNMFLDVLYSMRQFFAPNFNSLKDFKHSTHKIFPNLLDTKYMCSQDNLKAKINSSILADILDTVSKKPFGLPDIEPRSEECSYTSKNGKEHDAGYDSYITGISFIGMALHLNIKPCEMNERSPKLKNLINRLFIVRLADICFINLTGKEPQPPRDHVFFITVPETWRHSNVVHHFRNYGGVYTSWLNSTSAYVALQNREHAPIVEKSIGQVDGFTITSFAAHQHAKNLALAAENETCLAAKRKIETVMADEDPSTSESKHKKLTKKQKQKARSAQTFIDNDDWAETPAN